jgi:hypothetical protein
LTLLGTFPTNKTLSRWSDNLASKHILVVRKCEKHSPIAKVLFCRVDFLPCIFQLLFGFCSKLWISVTFHSQKFNQRKH